MTDGEDDFDVVFAELRDDFVELGLAFGAQGGLVEVEEGVGRELDFLLGRFRRGTRDRSGRLGRFAFFFGDQVGIAAAGERFAAGVLGLFGGCGRPAGACLHAQAGTRGDDDVAGVGDVGNDAFRIDDDVGGHRAHGETERSEHGEQLEAGVFSHGSILSCENGWDKVWDCILEFIIQALFQRVCN